MSKDVDLTGVVKFTSQFNKVFGDAKAQQVACCRACKKMLMDAGFKYVDGKDRVDIMIWDTHLNLLPAPSYQDGMDLLNKMLDEGKPVIAGVNRQATSVGNANHATSHFVVIVGRQFNNARGRYEFRFYDPGTSHLSKGTHAENVFYIDHFRRLIGVSNYNQKAYTVTEVRPTL